MSKLEQKKTNTMSFTETRNVNIEIAKKAILVATGRELRHFDITEESFGKFMLTGDLRSGKYETNSVKAFVSWSDGQDGHGSVEVEYGYLTTTECTAGETGKKRYACWKNEKGAVEVAPWYTPPKVYEYQRTYGLKYPRNRRPSFMRVVLAGALSIFLLVILAVLTWHIPQPANILSVVALVFLSVVIGGVIVASINKASELFREIEVAWAWSVDAVKVVRNKNPGLFQTPDLKTHVEQKPNLKFQPKHSN
ncbi:MAG: TIGR04086 family membrane protein [bacterium]|nr:TIGR04086 family membrane protein [bacterium]